jgi:Holliday junction resolvase RusA-like endonuclease
MGLDPRWLTIAASKGLEITSGGVPASKTSCVLPLPKSLNNCFANNKHNGGRHKTKAYKAWQTVAIPMLANVVAPSPCRVKITVIQKLRKNQDLDNLIKPLLDAAKIAGVFADDNCEFVRAVEITYRPEPDAIGVMIEFVPF